MKIELLTADAALFFGTGAGTKVAARVFTNCTTGTIFPPFFFPAGTKLAARAYTNSTTGTFFIAIVSAVDIVFGANVGDSAVAGGQGAAGAVDARQRQLVFKSFQKVL